MQCCVPVFAGALDETDAEGISSLLAALAHPVRLRIVSILEATAGGVACGCELEEPLGLSQPTVSHHLKKLREAGLVTGEKRGRWVHYRVVPEKIREITQALAPAESLAL
jgi:ArsR family transcriptional regulator, arsenate/arsenite/antimonite-responsive transcriptional repressor